MNKETPQERAERKSMYISYVLSKGKGMVEEDELIKSASEKFEAENLI